MFEAARVSWNSRCSNPPDEPGRQADATSSDPDTLAEGVSAVPAAHADGISADSAAWAMSIGADPAMHAEGVVSSRKDRIHFAVQQRGRE